MRANDGLTNGEPQANAALTVGDFRPAAIKLVEYLRLAAGRQTGTVSGHADLSPFAAGLGGDLDPAAAGRVANGIFQQIDEHLLDQVVGHPEQRKISRDLYVNAAAWQL